MRHTVLSLAACSVLLAAGTGGAAAGIIHVPGDAPTIQAGINLAAPGDTVLVAAGTYLEHVQLASGVDVFGAGSQSTIIDGGGAPVDVVRAVSVTQTTVRGFTITGAISGGGLPGGAGVFVNFPTSSVTIEDVIATGNDFGVAVFNSFQSAGPDIRDCEFHDNTFYGISDPGNGVISGCVIFANLDGIHQGGNSSQPQITGNTVWGNARDGFNYWNDRAPTLTNNIFAANGGYGIRERAPGTFVDPLVNFNLFWDNALGNYFDVQSGQVKQTAAEINAMTNASSNLVDDPLLCNPPLDFHLCADSPALGGGMGGADIGALPQGCGPCGTAAVAGAGAPASRFGLSARPNPFAPATEVTFELEEPGRAVLRVYAASGRVVRTLADRPLAAGAWSFAWDGRTGEGERAAAGVYLLDLRVDGRQVTQKVTMLGGR